MLVTLACMSVGSAPEAMSARICAVSGRESSAGGRCGEARQRLPTLVTDECVYPSKGTGRSEHGVQRPLDLSSRVLGRAESLDREFEEARRTHELATIVDAEELADFTPKEVFGRVTHLALRLSGGVCRFS